MDAVVDWLRAEQFKVDAVNRPEHTVRFGGTVAQEEQTFAVSIATFGNGQAYANTTDPQIPARFAGVIGAVQGLDNMLHAEPVARPPKPSSRALPIPSFMPPLSVANWPELLQPLHLSDDLISPRAREAATYIEGIGRYVRSPGDAVRRMLSARQLELTSVLFQRFGKSSNIVDSMLRQTSGTASGRRGRLASLFGQRPNFRGFYGPISACFGQVAAAIVLSRRSADLT